MTHRITVDVDPDTLELVLDALRIDSAKRQRAASLAALELERDVERKDKRPGAVLVTKALAEAGRLEEFARALATAAAVGKLEELAAAGTQVVTAGGPVTLDNVPTTPAALHAELEELRHAGELPPSALDEDLDDEEGVIGADELGDLRQPAPVAPA